MKTIDYLFCREKLEISCFKMILYCLGFLVTFTYSQQLKERAFLYTHLLTPIYRCLCLGINSNNVMVPEWNSIGAHKTTLCLRHYVFYFWILNAAGLRECLKRKDRPSESSSLSFNESYERYAGTVKFSSIHFVEVRIYRLLEYFVENFSRLEMKYTRFCRIFWYTTLLRINITNLTGRCSQFFFKKIYSVDTRLILYLYIYNRLKIKNTILHLYASHQVYLLILGTGIKLASLNCNKNFIILFPPML